MPFSYLLPSFSDLLPQIYLQHRHFPISYKATAEAKAGWDFQGARHMKIKVETDPNITEDEIILHCKELNEETITIQKRIAEIIQAGLKLTVVRGDQEYFLELKEILFFETAGVTVAVHTTNQIYETHLRLYELEKMLPGNFLRVSKSTIINTDKIRSIRKNIAGASEVEFDSSAKKAFVSRSYFKVLTNKLEEKRLKN